ncbi:arsenate reductase ArsC [Hydrogenimonas sp.]
MKRILILDIGNAARSIMAEALVNHHLKRSCNLHAESAGIVPKESIDRETIQVLAEDGIETEHLWSKGLDDLKRRDFDLVVTVCDNLKEACPVLPGAKKVIHIGFENPDGKPFEAYERTIHQLKRLLLPRIEEELCEEER